MSTSPDVDFSLALTHLNIDSESLSCEKEKVERKMLGRPEMSECAGERKRNKGGRDSILNSKIVHRNNNKNVTDVSDEDAHKSSRT